MTKTGLEDALAKASLVSGTAAQVQTVECSGTGNAAQETRTQSGSDDQYDRSHQQSVGRNKRKKKKEKESKAPRDVIGDIAAIRREAQKKLVEAKPSITATSTTIAHQLQSLAARSAIESERENTMQLERSAHELTEFTWETRELDLREDDLVFGADVDAQLHRDRMDAVDLHKDEERAIDLKIENRRSEERAVEREYERRRSEDRSYERDRADRQYANDRYYADRDRY